MNRFWNPLKAYRKECVLGPAFKLLEALFELAGPLIIARLVDEGLRLSTQPVVLRCALLLALMAVLGLAASVTAQYFAARAAIGFSSRLRRLLFAHIQSLSYSDQDRLGSSTLITRLTADVNQVQTGVNLGLRLLLRSPF
ncbi:MAG: ABC transporter ATP-binding protein, partial [Clostridia bacterium]|nr:ABC transporter ATP-binding protein [Clostridia bacterium]